MIVKYINRSRNGLKNGHMYTVKIHPPSHNKYVYDVEFLYDGTAEIEMEKIMNYASMISLKRNFEGIDESEIE